MGWFHQVFSGRGWVLGLILTGILPGWAQDEYALLHDQVGTGNMGTGLYVMNPDGTDVREIVSGIYSTPSVSRDGKHLLYVGQHPAVATCLSIYRVPLDAQSVRVLLTPAIGWSLDSSFSPNNDWIVYRVYIPPTGGGIILPDPTPTPEFGRVPFSRPFSTIEPQAVPLSGEYIAFAKADGSDALNAAHRDFVLQSGMQVWTMPDWHPSNENRVAVSVSGQPYSYPTSSIYLISPDGSFIQELFKPSFNLMSGLTEKDEFPSWSPDGQSLAYVSHIWNMSTNKHTYSIRVVKADASDAPGILITPEYEIDAIAHGLYKPVWSPDGQWIAFTKTQAAEFGVPIRFDIFKVRSDGRELTQLTFTGKSTKPAWIRKQDLSSNLRMAILGKVIPGDGSPTPSPPTPTATPTQTPGPTDTPVPAFTPTLPDGNRVQPALVYEYDQSTLEDCGWSEIPGGFTGAAPGSISCGRWEGHPIPSSVDQKGMGITVQPGEVVFTYASQTVAAEGNPVLLRLSVRADAPGASVTLAALRGAMSETDGSIATHMPMSASGFVDQERLLVLVYEPDTGDRVTPVIQVAATGNNGPVTVWVDRLEVYRIEPGMAYPGFLWSSTP
ncbi:MAG TPA: hypothetical protein PLH79_02415 [bacterium]|nr:hypothetical protein [bacterium]